jgi:hypothetical protein
MRLRTAFPRSSLPRAPIEPSCQQQVAATAPHPPPASRDQTLGTFGADLDKPRKSRWVVPALAAAAAAAVVGFGAYVISARAGLNEPPVVAAVNSRDLGAEARALERASGGLSPHRFSQAWGCARHVTDERITGLVSSTVDGMPALLVYTESGDSTHVTVVTGCGGGTPAAGPSAVVPR